MMCCFLKGKYVVRVTVLRYSVIMRNEICVLYCCVRRRCMGLPYKGRETASENDEWRIMSPKEDIPLLLRVFVCGEGGCSLFEQP